MSHTFVIFLWSVLFVGSIHCGALIGIDLGSQWHKIATVQHGKGFEIVLNDQSARKTHTLIGWNKEERLFGSDAFNMQVKNPKHVYSYLSTFLGKSLDHPTFTSGKDWVSFQVTEREEKESFGIIHDKNTTFSPEELVAMILRRAKELATASTGAPVRDCVITVPPFLTQRERQAVLDAADIAGLNVLSLLNDITAFALTYAKDRNFENDTQNVIFYDVGATSTKAILVTYQAIQDVKSKKNATIGQMLVRSSSWDQTLGGRFIDRNLVNFFKKTIKSKHADVDVNDVKLTLRLLREAAKVKEILSANQMAQAHIVGLGDHDDMIIPLTRKEFEDLNEDIWKRVLVPINEVLQDANMTKDEVNFVELVGGSTRVPKVQTVLKEFFDRKDLDRHVNGDEGAAIGAAFYAAGLSSQFHVKEIRVRDITPYPINVKISLEQNSDLNPDQIEAIEEEGEDQSNTALFRKFSKLNTRKGLSFYTYSNFSLDLAYVEPQYPNGPREVLKANVSGMPSVGKYNLTDKPKVHASFKLTTAGVVVLDHVDAEILFMHVPPPKPTVTKGAATSAQDESTKEGQGEEGKDAVDPADMENQEALDEENQNKDQESQRGDKTVPLDADVSAPEVVITEPIKKTQTVPLKFTTKAFGASKEEIRKSEARLGQFDLIDTHRKELQKERNSLEAFIYETRDKLTNEENIQFSTEEEREVIGTQLSLGSDWLMENEDSATAAEYRQKLKEIRERPDKVFFRVKEHRVLPAAVADLQSSVSSAQTLISNITNILNVTEEERDKVLKLATDTQTWITNQLQEQQALAKTVDPILTSDMISKKKTELEWQTKLLLKKPKKKVEKKKVVPSENATTTEPTETPENNDKVDTEVPPAEEIIDHDENEEQKDEL